MTKHAVTTVTTTVKPADPSASHPAPGQDRRGVTVRGHNGHAHLFPLLFGLVDAHVSRVDYFDTVGGERADEGVARTTLRSRPPRALASCLTAWRGAGRNPGTRSRATSSRPAARSTRTGWRETSRRNGKPNPIVATAPGPRGSSERSWPVRTGLASPGASSARSARGATAELCVWRRWRSSHTR